MFKLNNRCCSTSELPLVQCRKKSYKIITWQLKKDHIKSGCTKTNLCFIITVHKFINTCSSVISIGFFTHFLRLLYTDTQHKNKFINKT